MFVAAGFCRSFGVHAMSKMMYEAKDSDHSRKQREPIDILPDGSTKITYHLGGRSHLQGNSTL